MGQTQTKHDDHSYNQTVHRIDTSHRSKYYPFKESTIKSNHLIQEPENSNATCRPTNDNAYEEPTIMANTTHLIHCTLKEPYMWLKNDMINQCLTINEMRNWITVGKKVKTEDECTFCNEIILAESKILNDTKNKLKESSANKLRAVCNPFEKVNKLFFCSRSALKLANIDSIFDLKNPTNPDKRSLLEADELFYFASLGGGSNGFADYLLWRKGWQTQCFGITPRGSANGMSSQFHKFASDFETVNIFRGSKRDADIRDPETIATCISYVHERVPNEGVHLVIADEAILQLRSSKETASKQLHFCCCLMALALLRTHGTLVLKLFDTLTPFTVGLIYIMYRCFHRICLIKPNMSRPTNSERYLICQWKLPDTNEVVRHMIKLNKSMERMKNSDTTILELVSLEVMRADNIFFEYIIQCNNAFLANEIENLKKMFIQKDNVNLRDHRKIKIAEQCMKLWNIPPKINCIAHREANPSVALLMELLTQLGYADYDFSKNIRTLTKSEYGLTNIFSESSNWHFTHLSEKRPTFFASLGGQRVFMFDAEQKKWQLVENDINLVMPHSTLVYGELVNEYYMNRGREVSSTALQIIDGICVGGTHLFDLPLTQRLRFCNRFADAINNPYSFSKNRMNSFKARAVVRCKSLLKFEELVPFLWSTKNNLGRLNKAVFPIISIPPKQEAYKKFKYSGILFLRYNNSDKFYETFSELISWKWDNNFNDVLNIDGNTQRNAGTNKNVYLSDFNELFKSQNIGFQ